MTDTPAAYLRTSLEDFNRAHGLADQSQSISNQRKVILEYVQHNPEFSEVQIREFIDDGLTGTNTDRPQFQAMIEAARRGEVKCIIVKDLSRFGRNYLDVGDYLEHIFPFWGSGSSRSTMAMTANSMRAKPAGWILPFAISCTKITAEIFPSRSVPQCTPA